MQQETRMQHETVSTVFYLITEWIIYSEPEARHNVSSKIAARNIAPSLTTDARQILF